MKINIVQTFVGIAIGALISYGLYNFHASESKLLLSVGSFLFLAITLGMSFGSSFEFPRTTTNVRVISGVFFLIGLISNLIFTFIKFSDPSYIVINGILFLVFILVAYSISKAKQ
jgi:hypothetical protein